MSTSFGMELEETSTQGRQNKQNSNSHQDSYTAFYCFSIFVGVVVLLAEIGVIVAVVAVDPSDLRMPMEMALTKVQRAVLGGVTLFILLEALVFGVIDVCKFTFELLYRSMVYSLHV